MSQFRFKEALIVKDSVRSAIPLDSLRQMLLHCITMGSRATAACEGVINQGGQ